MQTNGTMDADKQRQEKIKQRAAEIKKSRTKGVLLSLFSLVVGIGLLVMNMTTYDPLMAFTVIGIIFIIISLLYIVAAFPTEKRVTRAAEMAQSQFEAAVNAEVASMRSQVALGANPMDVVRDRTMETVSLNVKKENNEASVIKRAAAGAVIAGPAGAVVGAVSAADKNNRTNAGGTNGESASVVKRAAAGAVIAGPAGAVVGAVSAADKNNRNKN